MRTFVALVAAVCLAGCGGPGSSPAVGDDAGIPDGAVAVVGYSTMNWDYPPWSKGGPGGIAYIRGDGSVVDVPTKGLEAIEIAQNQGRVYFRDWRNEYISGSPVTVQRRDYRAFSAGASLSLQDGTVLFLDNRGGGEKPGVYYYDASWWHRGSFHTGEIPAQVESSTTCGNQAYILVNTSWPYDGEYALQRVRVGTELRRKTVTTWRVGRSGGLGEMVCVDGLITISAGSARKSAFKGRGRMLTYDTKTGAKDAVFLKTSIPEAPKPGDLSGDLYSAGSFPGRVIWITEKGYMISINPRTGRYRTLNRVVHRPYGGIYEVAYDKNRLAVSENTKKGAFLTFYSLADGRELQRIPTPELKAVLSRHDGATVSSLVILPE